MGAWLSPLTFKMGSGRWRGPEALLEAATLVGCAVALVTAWAAGPGLVLPVLSGVLLVSGLVIAFMHWGDPASSPRLTFKDVGAALVFAVFAAALISDPSHYLPLTGASNQAVAVR